MRWLEFALRIALVVTLFLYLLSQSAGETPIIELALIIIYSSQYYLTNQWRSYPDDDEAIPRDILSDWPFWIYLLECIVTSYFIPSFWIFTPVLFYEYYICFPAQYLGFALPLLGGLLLDYSFFEAGFITGLATLSSHLHTIVINSIRFETTSYEEIDTLRFLNERFRSEQQSLISLQDERVTTSVLSERKRIVEEIHDILGHQISSAVIQVGALQYLVEDEEVKKSLGEIQSVLNTSMSNVREVIHAERESAVDVEREIARLVADFSKAKISFSYSNQSILSNLMAHSLVNIVTEALTNINKHSDATQVTIRFTELDDKWTLLVADNGTKKATQQTSGGGIGLMNIEERVVQLNGSINISSDRGFRIFIIIPKEGE